MAGHRWRQSTSTLAGTLLLWLSLTAAHSWAHRGHGVWTDIVWSQDRFEITHRLHAADAITITRRTGSHLGIDTPEGLARLALYVEERFAIAGGDDPQPAVITLGAEVEDDFVYVYQEWPVELGAKAFPIIQNDILIDLEPRAQRFVRIITQESIEERRF